MTILFNPACHSCSCVATLQTFVGGEFTTVGGTSRLRLARLEADGTLNTAWTCNVTHSGGNSRVAAMVFDGTTLFIGGHFDDVGGSTRVGVAAIDAVSGSVTSWAADISAGVGDEVYTLLLDGTNLYVGGFFSTLGGSARNNVGVVDASTAAVGGWDPNANNEVICIAEDAGIIYFGGSFTTVSGGTARNRLAAFDTGGTIQAWNPGVTTAASSVRGMKIDSSIVYIVGNFSTVAGSTRRGAAAIDTGATLQSWNPDIKNSGGVNPGNCRTLAIDGTTVYIGGNFLTVGGVTRDCICAIGTDGTLSSWNPILLNTGGGSSNNGVYGMFVEDDNVYCAGVIQSVNGTSRNDAFVVGTDGTLASWNANLAGATITGRIIIAAE